MTTTTIVEALEAERTKAQVIVDACTAALAVFTGQPRTPIKARGEKGGESARAKKTPKVNAISNSVRDAVAAGSNTSQRIATATGLSKSAVLYRLGRLAKAGEVVSRGTGKETTWVLKA